MNTFGEAYEIIQVVDLNEVGVSLELFRRESKNTSPPLSREISAKGYFVPESRSDAFLFSSSKNRARCRKSITGDSGAFTGHFNDWQVFVVIGCSEIQPLTPIASFASTTLTTRKFKIGLTRSPLRSTCSLSLKKSAKSCHHNERVPRLLQMKRLFEQSP